jgi:nucleolar protein 4
MNGKEIKERKIAVDWALSKEKFEEAKAQEEPKAAAEDAEEEEEEGSSDEETEDEDAEVEENEDDDVDVIMEDQEEKPVKPTLPAVEEGSTLFIRNLPFEATEEELRDL